MPTTLGDEFDYNPFLRTDKQELRNGLRDLGYTVPGSVVQMQGSEQDEHKEHIIDESGTPEEEATTRRKKSEVKSKNEILEEEVGNEVDVEGVELERAATVVIESAELRTQLRKSSGTAGSNVIVEVDSSSSSSIKETLAIEGEIKNENVTVEIGERNNAASDCSFKQRLIVLRLLRAAKDAYVGRREKLVTEGLKANC